MRYKLTLQYDGTHYHGWQRQPHERKTLQEAVEAAAAKVCSQPTTVTASGRTDEGVHALGQVAHFDTDKAMPCERFVAAFNHWLPGDIRVTDCVAASEDFDARKSAKRKTYEYWLYTPTVGNTHCVENPLRSGRELFVPCLDERKMNAAAALLVGVHDFAAFRSSGSSARTTVREIYSASVAREGDRVIVSVCGNGFLYNMVRIIVGALVRIGQGRVDDSVITDALLSGDRRLVPDIAPPYALYLKNVEYSRE